MGGGGVCGTLEWGRKGVGPDGSRSQMGVRGHQMQVGASREEMGVGPEGGGGPLSSTHPPQSGTPSQIGVPPGRTGWHETTLTSHQSGIHDLIFFFCSGY